MNAPHKRHDRIAASSAELRHETVESPLARPSFSAVDFQRNGLLDALTDEERLRWRPVIRQIRLRRGQVLHEPGAPSTQLWFPTSAAISILCATEDGASCEIALVGHEGVVGWSPLPGHGSSLCRTVVSGEGEGFRVGAQFVDAEFERARSLRQRLLRYAEALIAQMAQMIACNRHHVLEQQLCRLLLSSLDRTSGPWLDMTHESMAVRLGVRREGVTAAARVLRECGAINYRRGHIQVLDRAALEARSCECYRVVANEYDRLLGRTPAGRS